MPDVAGQSVGKSVHLDQFRGRPLLLTFIYTRCPVPISLLMSNNFSEVLRQLQKSPEGLRVRNC